MKHLLFILMEIDPNDPPQEGPFYVIDNFPELQFVIAENGQLKSFPTYPEPQPKQRIVRTVMSLLSKPHRLQTDSSQHTIL